MSAIMLSQRYLPEQCLKFRSLSCMGQLLPITTLNRPPQPETRALLQVLIESALTRIWSGQRGLDWIGLGRKSTTFCGLRWVALSFDK